MTDLLKQNEKGFTLIELMIIIGIIGILAAIAIPNFVAYRDKSFCSGAEADANNIAAALADYYAIPTNSTFIGGAVPTVETANVVLTRNNTATISGNLVNAIVITVTEGSRRCPNAYMVNQPSWAAATSIFTKTIN